jgi:HEAT repeat protein
MDLEASEASSASEPPPTAEASPAGEPPPTAQASSAAEPLVASEQSPAVEAQALPELPSPAEPPPAPALAAAEPPIPADHAAQRPTPADPAAAQLDSAKTPAARAALLLRLGRSGDQSVAGTLGAWTEAEEPSVRAAAYEALGRLLEREPSSLEPYLRTGLADTDARVRRRVVLAAATARKLALRPLLAPLTEDPDPQVRRVVREVLRQAPPTAEEDPHPEAPRRSDDARPDGDPVRFRAASGGAP